MAIFIACVSSLVLLLLVSRYVLQLLGNARGRLPPGPLPLPIIGNLLDVALTSRLLHRSLARLAKRHGPLMTLRLGTAVVIVVSSPDAAREVLQTHNLTLAGRVPPDAWQGQGHAANSVFVLPPNHNKWRSLRRVGTENLLSARRLDLLRPVHLLQDAVVSHVSSELAASSSAVVLVVHVASRAAVDVLWRAMFSCQVDASAYRELHDLARLVGAVGLKPNVSDFFPVLAVADLQGVRRNFARKLGVLYQLIDVQIQRRRRDRSELAAAGGARQNGDLLDAMLDMAEQDEDINNDTVKAFLTDLLLAAIETVPNGVEWAMAELLKNPETMRKLKEELRSVVGGKIHVDHSDMERLPFL